MIVELDRDAVLSHDEHRKNLVAKSRYVKNVCDETRDGEVAGKNEDRDGY